MAGRKPTIADGMRAERGPAGLASTPHPSHEELLAYHQNRLEPEAEERLQDHLAACRDCALDAADLAAFLDPAEAEELDERADRLTAEESEALWQNLEAQRGAGVKAPAPVPPPAPWYRRMAVLQAVAAVLLISTASSVTLWTMARDRLRRLEGGEVNVAVRMLTPIGFLREGEPAAPDPPEVPPGAVVVLLPAGDVPEADHEVEILTLDNHLVWSAPGLRPVPPASTFHLRLPLHLAAGTTYRIRVSAAGSGPRRDGEVYEVRIGEPGLD